MPETCKEVPMTITVKVTAARNHYNSPIRANATVTLGGCFVVHGVRVLKGANGLFVTMPARQGSDGVYRETCHPVSTGFACELNTAVLTEYQMFLERQMEESRILSHVTEPGQSGGGAKEV